MPASEGTTRTFLLDTNVIVAAIRHARRQTDSLRLLLNLLGREDVKLVGNGYWVEEMIRYAEEFRSETVTWLISALLERTRVVRVTRNFVTVCARYVTTPDLADVAHAATCLQEHAILISNDRHFDRIRDAGVVEVWSISDAIRAMPVR